MSLTVLLVVAGLAAGTWLMWHVRTPPPVADSAATPAVSVVIPARNEETTLPCLLASLAEQQPSPQVIVVDDSSDDRTAEVATAAGATLVTSPLRPDGWVAKSWACATGAALATGDLLVFLDADTWLGKDGLARIVAAHARLAPDGLLSVEPFHRTEKTHEQFSAFCNAVTMMATGAFRPGTVRNVDVAFGPCLVTSAAAYQRAGGHVAVAGEIIEDIHLARAYDRAGQPVCCLAGGTAISFRMYPHGRAQLVEGWTKNLAGGARLAPMLPTLGAVAWVGACVAVAVNGVTALLGLAGQGPIRWWPLAAWTVVAVQLRWILRRIGAFRWWVWVLFPLPLAAFVSLFTRSVLMRSLRRRVMWRGREVRVGRSAT